MGSMHCAGVFSGLPLRHRHRHHQIGAKFPEESVGERELRISTVSERL